MTTSSSHQMARTSVAKNCSAASSARPVGNLVQRRGQLVSHGQSAIECGAFICDQRRQHGPGGAEFSAEGADRALNGSHRAGRALNANELDGAALISDQHKVQNPRGEASRIARTGRLGS